MYIVTKIIHHQNCRLLEYINQNYLYTANETNGANKLGDLHTMQQSNKAMFLKNSRTRPREFYRFSALML